jgi:hypothetical protein
MNVTINSKSLGITGVVLLVIGCFLPFASVPLFGSVSYVRGGAGDGLIVIGLAALGIVFIVRERYKALWLPAIASAGLVTFSIASSVFGADTNYLSLEIGPLVIYAGAALLGWAAKSAPASERPVAERIRLFSKGSRVSSLLVSLGVVAILSTPIVLVILNVQNFDTPFIMLMLYWFYVGGIYSLIYVLAPLLGLYIFSRGYPMWSWAGAVYPALVYSGLEYQFFPSGSLLFIIPVVGAIIYGVGALVASNGKRKRRRETESSSE